MNFAISQVPVQRDLGTPAVTKILDPPLNRNIEWHCWPITAASWLCYKLAYRSIC